MSAENQKHELVKDLSGKFRGHLAGEFAKENRSDILIVDLDGHRFLFDHDTKKADAIAYAKKLLEQYK